MASAREFLARNDSTTAVQVPLVSSLLFTCNPKQLARLSTLLASFTTTVSSSSLSCACEHQVGNELYRRSEKRWPSDKANHTCENML